jgi:hypothetical protein
MTDAATAMPVKRAKRRERPDLFVALIDIVSPLFVLSHAGFGVPVVTILPRP